jgi:hypothetical protein
VETVRDSKKARERLGLGGRRQLDRYIFNHRAGYDFCSQEPVRVAELIPPSSSAMAQGLGSRATFVGSQWRNNLTDASWWGVGKRKRRKNQDSY